MSHHLEAIPSEIDYFENEIIQTSVVDEFDRDFIPLASLAGDGPIEFLVRGADNLLLDLNNSKIEVRITLVKAADGGAIAGGDHVGVVNLMLHSLFANVEVELCGKTYGDPNSLYPYRAMFETLLNLSSDLHLTWKGYWLAEGYFGSYNSDRCHWCKYWVKRSFSGVCYI